MRVLVAASCLLMGVNFLYAEAIPKPPANPISGKIDWVYDYDEGKRLSKETGKPMFVVFRCER